MNKIKDLKKIINNSIKKLNKKYYYFQKNVYIFLVTINYKFYN